jgi:hypothetical protein
MPALIEDEETLAAIRYVQMSHAGRTALGAVKFKKKKKKISVEGEEESSSLEEASTSPEEELPGTLRSGVKIKVDLTV